MQGRGEETREGEVVGEGEVGDDVEGVGAVVVEVVGEVVEEGDKVGEGGGEEVEGGDRDDGGEGCGELDHEGGGLASAVVVDYGALEGF